MTRLGTKLSNTGKNSTVNFTARDICGIIKSLASSEVRFFRLGDMEIHLGPRPEDDPFAIDESADAPPVPRMELTEEQKQEIEYAQTQELLAMNPVAFEQSIVDDSEASLYLEEDTYA